MNQTADPLTRTLTVLDCVAADPGVNGVLLLDLDPSLLVPLGSWLARRIGRARVLMLDSSTPEEDLWLRTRLVGNEFRISPGLLVEDQTPPVLLVPDLCRAGLPVTRAAVALAGATFGSAEALGHSFRWQPQARWLAAASRTEVAQLSPHLLDRFPIRVNAADLRTHPPEDPEPLQLQPLPRITATAAHMVMAVAPPVPSMRRDLALARVARALAMGEPEVTPDHVSLAADLLSISGRAQPDTTVPEHVDITDSDADIPFGQYIPEHDAPESAPTVRVSVLDAGPTVPMEAMRAPDLEPDSWPYPEDDPEALPAVASLKAAGRKRLSAEQLRGHAIGVQATTGLRDLALVATVLEAAKFQTIRRQHVSVDQLIISPADLRRHRRRPEPTAALVLVLDHSCRRGWDWSAAMAPYLRWAYKQNMAVSVIEFGHRPTSDELTAERYQARSVSDPRLLVSLSRGPGLASPLAHALDLAVQALRRFMRGRAQLDEAVLLIATDGRGNVPLDASLRGRIPSRAGRLGITDALAIAAAVRTLPRVRPIVIAPELHQYADLPLDLAEAMGGEVIQVSEPDR
jgi:magnesium chelatase subunit D